MSMTLIDLIKLGFITSDTQAERFAAELLDRWHPDLIPGELHDVLGLTPREYQAWTTGGVSLLTIAHGQQTSHPTLDVARPWFKLSGSPGQACVGYLEDRPPRAAARATRTAQRKRKTPAARR